MSDMIEEGEWGRVGNLVRASPLQIAAVTIAACTFNAFLLLRVLQRVRSDSSTSESPNGRATADVAPVGSSGVPEIDDLAALPQALKIVGAIVAPTTMLTGLLFYFGRIYANGSFGYFGVNFTALDLTISDYLIRSADGLIVPLAVVTGLAIVALWLHQLLEYIPVGGRRIATYVVSPMTTITGLALMGTALLDVFWAPIFVSQPALRGALFATGAILLAYSVHSIRQLLRARLGDRMPKRSTAFAVSEWAALFLFVSIGLFWAAGSYASAVGLARAQEIEATLSESPAVALFSEKRLSLSAPGVVESPCSAGSSYLFRYEGLKLVLQSGNQYLFLPGTWKEENGTAFLIPRGDELRLEFSPAGQPLHADC